MPKINRNSVYEPGRNGFFRENGRYPYSYADNLKSAVEGLKRCRNVQDFILVDGSPDLKKIRCQVCGNKLSESSPNNDRPGSNRCSFNPKKKTVVGAHYYCSWKNIMNQILDLGRVINV